MFRSTRTYCRISSGRNTSHSLKRRASVVIQHGTEMHTKILSRIAPTSSLLMRSSLWTVLVGIMPIPDVIEEVDLILPCEQCSADAMNRCISPTLFFPNEVGESQRTNTRAHLIIKSALFIEVVKEFRICFTPPEVKISDFKVAPDWRRDRQTGERGDKSERSNLQ